MPKSKIIIGKHKSIALATRHLRQLQRDNPNATVQITSRRNIDGKKSTRGRFFRFKITLIEEELDDLEKFFKEYDVAEDFEVEEYASSADYGEEEPDA